ncbi:hypothetical protein CPLU01_15228 [Colletotrichum plurivorum]|uniref:Uncharacterized protein n=1 Tax=Colletotrichum plurivorum TaxID=2175906 RepID=A0A8H6JD00_9PEZI|nr:hypothetical protein CPLU01_15228 [Colletotrichum plurivorum]
MGSSSTRWDISRLRLSKQSLSGFVLDATALRNQIEERSSSYLFVTMSAPNDSTRRAVSPLSAAPTRQSSVSGTTEGDFEGARNHHEVKKTSPSKESRGSDPGRGFTEHENARETPAWRIWHLEALSSLLALSCLVAMAVILAIYQCKPLPAWPDLISINTLIAVFTAVFRASLILPIAEVTFKNTPIGLAFGALITVAALAVDPFSQAIIEHRTCPQVVQETPKTMRFRDPPTTPRTNNYTGLLPGAKYKAEFARAALDLSTSTALYRGLVDPRSSVSLLDRHCSTGNCTFGEASGGGDYFATLEMCYSCEDVTSEVVNRTTEDETRFTLGTELEVNNVTALDARTTNGSRNASEPFFSIDLLTLKYEDYCTRHKGCTSSFIRNMRPFAKQVAYSLILNSTVEDGRVRKCAPVQTGDERTGDFVPARPNRKINRPKTWEKSSEWELWPVECVFAVEMTPYYGISVVLHELLSQNLTATMLIGEVPPLSGPVWLQTMYHEGNATLASMDTAWAGLAASISATMRNRPWYVDSWEEKYKYAVSERRVVVGTALTTETCVIVHWGWIAYPGALLVLQLVFLALVMGRRWGRDGGRWSADWKSSPLALLFHGLDDNLHQGYGEVSSARSMNRAARQIKAQLMEDSGNRGSWRFR